MVYITKNDYIALAERLKVPTKGRNREQLKEDISRKLHRKIEERDFLFLKKKPSPPSPPPKKKPSPPKKKPSPPKKKTEMTFYIEEPPEGGEKNKPSFFPSGFPRQPPKPKPKQKKIFKLSVPPVEESEKEKEKRYEKAKSFKFKLLTTIGSGLKLKKVGKKSDEFYEDEEESISIEQFIHMLTTNEKFGKMLAESSEDILKRKFIFYSEKLEEVNKELEHVKRKADEMIEEGYSKHDVNANYPVADLGVFAGELERIIEIIYYKLKNLSAQKIAEDLMNVIEDTKTGFGSIIGRTDIKRQFLAQIYAFSKNWKTFYQSFNNIALLGPAGAGKTQLAKVLANLFAASGILATNKVKIVSRQDLTSMYIAETSVKTKRVLMTTLEGVLVIDEAYQLTPCELKTVASNDPGPEAITEIVNFLDKYIGMNVVIVAGYKDIMMKCFFTSNEGLPRRFPFQYVLDNYNDSELTRILIRVIQTKSDVDIDQETANFLFTLVNNILQFDSDIFKNQAGDMLNLGTSIVKSINFSVKREWKDGDLTNNIPLIVSGFNSYLRIKGFILS